MPGRLSLKLVVGGKRGLAGMLAAALALLPVIDRSHAARPDEPAAQSAPATQAQPPAQKRVQPTAPVAVPAIDPAKTSAERLKRMTAAKSWGYQLIGLNVAAAAASPLDLLVIDVTTGLDADRPLRPEEIARLKRKPDGSPRLVIGHLSIGDAEDYRQDYFSAEYLTEDAPQWLGPEHAQWRGNRIVKFCHEGWQRTVIGDDNGRGLYNSIDASPLHRLVELGLDGVYLDRADVWAEVKADCPDGETAMVEFIARIAASARRKNPGFLVVMQNAEELSRHPRLIETIDAIAKEDLFHSAHTGQPRPASAVKASIAHLKRVKDAGRPVFVVDYVLEQSKKADTRRRIEEQGFVPYFAPRDLGRLAIPGRDF